MIELLFGLLCGPLDRIRGDRFHLLNSRLVDKLAYGAAIAAAAGLYNQPLALLLVAIAMAIGMSPGWGTPYGAFLDQRPMDPIDQEWWQVGILKRHTQLALLARGVIWGLPIVPVALYLGQLTLLLLIPIISVSFIVALYLTRLMPKDRDLWADSETFRGLLIGVSTAVIFSA